MDELNSFDMTIEYIQGESNVVADFLSRLPPCNRGVDGEPCRQCTRRMLGHGKHGDHLEINAVQVKSVDGKTPDAVGYRTRSGRVSVRMPRDPAFDYSDGRRIRSTVDQPGTRATTDVSGVGDCTDLSFLANGKGPDSEVKAKESESTNAGYGVTDSPVSVMDRNVDAPGPAALISHASSFAGSSEPVVCDDTDVPGPAVLFIPRKNGGADSLQSVMKDSIDVPGPAMLKPH